MFTREVIELSPKEMTRAHAVEYFWQWLAGSMALAVIVAVPGTIITYVIARLVRKK
jgi:hypothetical protein